MYAAGKVSPPSREWTHPPTRSLSATCNPSFLPPPPPPSRPLIHFSRYSSLCTFSITLYKINHRVCVHSFYLAYFTQSNYFETHLCSIISSRPPYTNLYLFFQTSPLPLNSPLEALRSIDKSRINHFSRSLPHAKYYFPIIQCFTSPLSISHRRLFLLSEQKYKCFMLLTSSKQNQDE